MYSHHSQGGQSLFFLESPNKIDREMINFAANKNGRSFQKYDIFFDVKANVMDLAKIKMALVQDYRQICSYYRLQLTTVNFEIVDTMSYWGQYDSKSKTIKLSERLIKSYSWSVVLGVLKHELAHHYVHEIYKNSDLQYHGPEFRKACEKLGVPAFFQRAQVDLTLEDLDWKTQSIVSEENPLFERIKKLMALACSDNENESRLASQKIQELITRNQITQIEVADQKNYEHLTLFFKNSRTPLHIKQIVSILVEHFFVYAVFQTSFDVAQSARVSSVELMGRVEDLLIAESVFYFLQNEIDQLFKQNKQNKLSPVDKKSLAWGFLDGFSKQLEHEKNLQIKVLESKALVLRTAEEKLIDYSRKIFPRLRNTGSRQRINQSAYNDGHEMGKKVKLRQVIEQKNRAFGQLLGFRQK